MKLFSCILDLIYPVLCINCGNSLVLNESIICTHCAFKLPVTNFHNDPSNPMIKALWGRVNIEFATSYLFFNKGGITQKLLHHLKYKNYQEVGINFGNRFGNQIIDNEFIKGIDFLIPVPLHAKKLKARGFNQSHLICLGLNQSLNKPISHELERISYTDTQTKRKRIERWFNVSEKFNVKNPESLTGKKILLVDDVFTTGATIDACCQAFKGIENIKIGVATLGLVII